MAVVRNPLESFVWGKGGAALTPEEIAQQREVEQALLAKNGIDTSPVGHWTQGIARVLGAAGGAYRRNKLDAAGAESNDYNSSIINSLLGGGAPVAPPSGPVSGSVPMSGAAGEISSTAPAVDISGNQQTFIDSLLPAAMEESKRTGVDPRIIVAQAAQETGWGKSAPGNNYFGIKSHGEAGGQVLPTNEVIDGQTVRVNDSFRQFGSPAESVRGYGDFILQNPRYKGLREAQGLDAQLEALQASGYATDPNYSQSVGSIARGIQLPQEVASASPQAAIQAIAPIGQTETASSPQQSPVVQQMAQAAPAQSGINPEILRALSDPRANEQTRAVAQMLMQQEQAKMQAMQEQQTWMQRQAYEQAQQANDPLRRQQLDMGAIELERARNPQPGFRTLTAEEKQANGLPANGAFQVGADGKIMQIGGGGININNEGSIPAGYMAVRDAEGRVTAIQPIPGSPQALEAEQAKRSQATRSGGKETAGNTIMTAAQRARDAMTADGLPATGLLGKIASISPSTNAAEVRRQIGVLKSSATIETLGAMRAASPTGGALGSVTEKEGEMLAAKAGALDPDSPNFSRDLDDYERTLLETIHGPEVGKAIFNQSRKKGPAVVDGYQIEEVD